MSPALMPETAVLREALTASAETPLKEAFVLSTSKTSFLWGSSTYQSMSTTPGVFSKTSFIFAATSIRPSSLRAVDLGDER